LHLLKLLGSIRFSDDLVGGLPTHRWRDRIDETSPALQSHGVDLGTHLGTLVVQVIFAESCDEPKLFQERDVGGVDECEHEEPPDERYGSREQRLIEKDKKRVSAEGDLDA
jgi:hypothetical protein